MKYNIVSPYFFKKDIYEILNKFKQILSGKGLLTMGRYVKEFENNFAKYIGSNYAVATSSCTSALETVLESINLKSDDEIILPTQTFIASGSSIAIRGGRPAFCEIDDNFLLDFKDMKKRITKKTKAVIIVHFAGLIHPEIFQIREYLQKRNIFLIEDAAHAHGAIIANIHAGNIGDFGCFSFFSTKIITTGEGGMITTNKKSLFLACNSIRNRGIDVKRGSEIYSNIGSNRRMTEFQGILGLYQLKRLEEFIKHRNKIANIYKEILKPLKDQNFIDFQRYANDARHAYWRFLIFLINCKISREEVRNRAKKFGIKIDWPYLPLLHLQPIVKKMYGTRNGFLKKTEILAKKHFCVPIHFGIKESDAVFIANKIKGIIE